MNTAKLEEATKKLSAEWASGENFQCNGRYYCLYQEHNMLRLREKVDTT